LRKTTPNESPQRKRAATMPDAARAEAQDDIVIRLMHFPAHRLRRSKPCNPSKSLLSENFALLTKTRGYVYTDSWQAHNLFVSKRCRSTVGKHSLDLPEVEGLL
jgi:hypothetical protein